MKEWLKKIFEIKDIVWFLIGLLVPCLWNLIKEKIKTIKMKKKIKKCDMEFADNSIISLAHGDPFFKISSKQCELMLDVPQELFYISMPEGIKKQILDIREDFFNTTWETEQAFFDNQTEKDMITEVSGILGLSVEDTTKMYLEEKENIALFFLEKVKAGDPYFIGEMYGVKKIDLSRKGSEERSNVKIDAYKTDYYTHRVMAAIYRRVYENKKNIVPENNPESYNKMRYFLTSMGMNVLLYLKDEKKIVFVKRSGKLVNMTRAMWHVSMNEAISITDISETNEAIDLDKCIKRGLNEELGVVIKGINIRYSDLFFLKDPFETGISAFVTINNMTFSELRELLYPSAKDKELESEGVIAVKVDGGELIDFMKKNELTDAAKYLTKMFLARHTKGSI